MTSLGEKFAISNIKVASALLIFLIAISLRISYQRSAIVDQPIRADAREYFLTAYNLFHHGVYSIEYVTEKNRQPRTIWRRTPGYPLFLYPFFYFSKTANEFVINVTLAQAFLGSLTCVLVFFIGSSILSFPWAIIAGLSTALSPHLIAMDDYLLSESLFTFSIVSATLILVWSFRKQDFCLALLSGAVFCFSSLVRSISGLLGPFMMLLFFACPQYWRTEKRSRFLIAPLLFLAGMVLVYLPYSHIRNVIISKSVWVTNESAWRHIVLGSDIGLNNFFNNKTVPEFKTETKKLIDDKAYGLSIIGKRFRENPLAYIKWYLGGKLLFMWKWDNIYIGDVYQYPMVAKGFHQGNWLSTIHRFMRWIHWPTFGLAIIGTLIFIFNWIRGGLRDSEKLLFAPILIFIYFSIILTILVPLPRYAIPIRPFVYLVGCYPLKLIGQFFHQLFQKRQLPA